MKKKWIMFAAVCAFSCCLGLVGCDMGSNTGEYDALNAMLDADYSQIVLTVTDTFDKNTSLTSEYTVKYSTDTITVTYTVERFNEASLDNPSTDIKTTLTGEAVIEDGAIVSRSGDDIKLPVDIAKPRLTFNKKYFENVNLTGVNLKADVKNADAFLGSQVSCTGMKVSATFLDVFYNINISYTSAGGNKVEYKYVFTH